MASSIISKNIYKRTLFIKLINYDMIEKKKKKQYFLFLKISMINYWIKGVISLDITTQYFQKLFVSDTKTQIDGYFINKR